VENWEGMTSRGVKKAKSEGQKGTSARRGRLLPYEEIALRKKREGGGQAVRKHSKYIQLRISKQKRRRK